MTATDEPSYAEPVWPRAAVFDCDGLLVDSAHCWRWAYEELARANGWAPDRLEMSRLAGASVGGAAAELGRQMGATVDEGQLRRLLWESFTAGPPSELPGARALVQALADRVPVGVASNAPADILDVVLKANGLAESVTAVVSAEETDGCKPEPDVYLEACRRLEVCPSDAIAFEDSALGAAAARKAGLFVVGVPSPPKTQKLDADLTVSSLREQRLLAFLGVEGPPDGSPSSRPLRLA